MLKEGSQLRGYLSFIGDDYLSLHVLRRSGNPLHGSPGRKPRYVVAGRKNIALFSFKFKHRIPDMQRNKS